LISAKVNNIERCIELMDKKKGDMKADINIKGIELILKI